MYFSLFFLFCWAFDACNMDGYSSTMEPFGDSQWNRVHKFLLWRIPAVLKIPVSILCAFHSKISIPCYIYWSLYDIKPNHWENHIVSFAFYCEPKVSTLVIWKRSRHQATFTLFSVYDIFFLFFHKDQIWLIGRHVELVANPLKVWYSCASVLWYFSSSFLCLVWMIFIPPFKWSFWVTSCKTLAFKLKPKRRVKLKCLVSLRDVSCQFERSIIWGDDGENNW